jgi:hypothetical protein
MDNDEPQIKISEKGSELTPSEVKKEADFKFKEINFILLTVVVILLVMVATLLIDSFHFNSATYKEYSEKTQSLDMIQKNNEVLLKNNEALLQEIKNNQEMLKNLMDKLSGFGQKSK